MKFISIVFFMTLSTIGQAQWLSDLNSQSKYEINFDKNTATQFNTTTNIQKTDFIKLNDFSLPFFCRIEDKIEKNSKIPIKMRLGSLNYVDFLENKNNNNYFYAPY